MMDAVPSWPVKAPSPPMLVGEPSKTGDLLGLSVWANQFQY